jgi:hypothetical protein
MTEVLGSVVNVLSMENGSRAFDCSSSSFDGNRFNLTLHRSSVTSSALVVLIEDSECVLKSLAQPLCYASAIASSPPARVLLYERFNGCSTFLQAVTPHDSSISSSRSPNQPTTVRRSDIRQRRPFISAARPDIMS